MKRWMIVLLLLGACSRGAEWTSSQAQEWMDSCANGPTACACMLDYFKEHGHSFEDIAGSDGFSIGFDAGFECGVD